MMNKKLDSRQKHSGMTKSGQSTVEYMLMVAAVIAVGIIFTTGDNSPFRTRLNSTMDITTNGMTNVANRLMR